METKFGFGQIGNSTPQWATWFFRVSLYIISAAILAINTLNVGRLGVNSEDIRDLTALLSFLIPVIHGFTRMFGLDIKPEDYQIK